MKTETILIIGSGRLARHLRHYFELLNEFESLYWSRGENTSSDLNEYLERADKIILAISDRAIIPFFETNLIKVKVPVMHLSGSCIHPNMLGFHPLCTFGDSFYTLDFYKSILFVIDDEKLRLEVAFLPNMVKLVSKEEKVYYHALCVMSGNFTQLLWLLAYKEFSRLGLNRIDLEPYLISTFQTIRNPHFQTATGPFARGDDQTINNHLYSLTDEMKPLYQVFLESFQQGVFRNEEHI